MKPSHSALLASIALGVALASTAGRSRAEDAPALSKEDGPFMALALTFRGPGAEALAIALASELREDQGLPACLYRAPGKAPMRYEGFAVLVGHAGSPAECRAIAQRLGQINPRSLAGTPHAKAGLTRSRRTYNPLLELPACGLPLR